MRYAIISDIHANLPAWNAVLEDIASLNIKHIINLGDVVGYGPNPSEVISSVREHASVSVIGNHDAVCANLLDPAIFNENARAVIEWTKEQLDADASQYLSEVPEKARPAGAGFLITHAEVVAPFDFGYILNAENAAKNFAACEDSLIFIGHTHFAGVFIENEDAEVSVHPATSFVCDPNKRYIINPGSVGDPRTADIAASYCIYDSETHQVEFRRVEFDIELYRQLLSASGLQSKPYFLRYLDDQAGGKKMQFPTVGDSDATPAKNLVTGRTVHTPNIDLKGSLAITKPKKKKSPALLLSLLALFLGAGTLTWILLNSSDSNADASNTLATDSTPDQTQQPAEELGAEVAATTLKSSEPAKPIIAKTLPISGRYVRISEPKGKFLSLTEVEVISKGKNVALKKKATQSSHHGRGWGTKASRAVDGTKANNNFTHTSDSRPMWWEVDLGRDHRINQINIWNRNGSQELLQRLDGFTLEVLDANRKTVYQTENNPGAKARILIR